MKTKSEKHTDLVKRIYCEYEYDFENPEDCAKLKAKGKTVPANPMFSFMMCTYNDVSVLNAAINSLISQECEDWELVILDNSDKSDRPWIMIQNVMSADPRIRGYRSQENCGWPKGASECMKYIKGKYTTFLAADDCINEGALKYMHQLLSEKQSDILWVSAGNTIYRGNEDVELSGIIAHAYKEYNNLSRSQNIVDIMKNCYYNSFYHYMRVDFLRENGIDFYEPYYADCGGMTKALAAANSMIATNAIVYFLTANTSQTKGIYTWDSYDFVFAKQWETVKEIFAEENYLDKEAVAYVAVRILNNLIGNVKNMLEGRCRNKYMNHVEKHIEERWEQLEALLENRHIQEMLVLSGAQARRSLLDTIYPYLLLEESEENLRDKPILNALREMIIFVENGDWNNGIGWLLAMLLQENNHVFIGFEYFAGLLEECSDEIVVRYQDEIQKVITLYTDFLNENGKCAEELWYIRMCL